LIERPQYALAYRNTLGTPLWVSWHLSAQDQGNVDRGKFQPDKDLPEGFTRLTPRDYTGTGFDRGHMCPSADRTATEEDNDATFLMTNIVPQAPGNNQGPWKELEDYCRELTKQGNELYIVAGPGGSKRKLARGRLNVPQFTWKVAVVLPESDGDDLARINAQTRVIAVKMPNLSTIRSRPWQSFRTTVRDIEQETSLNLLTNLPPSVQNALKQKQDSE
jgi:endonuclease G